MSTWTIAREAALRELWARTDLTATDVAKLLGVSRGAALGRASRLGLRKGHPDRCASYGWPTYVHRGVTLRLVSMQDVAMRADRDAGGETRSQGETAAADGARL